MEREDNRGKSVETTIELTGDYEEIASILGKDTRKYNNKLSVISEDMEMVLDIIARTGGTTKSQIADEVSGTTSAELDTDTVIYVLRVLELYNLVELDGNTWKPGPSLGTS